MVMSRSINSPQNTHTNYNYPVKIIVVKKPIEHTQNPPDLQLDIGHNSYIYKCGIFQKGSKKQCRNKPNI